MQTLEQARVFLGMLLTGALLGAAYDALMLLRLWLGAGRVLTGALDLLFGALCAAGICLSALMMRTEAFRWYVFAGALGGMGLYLTSVGMFVRFMCRKGRLWGQKRRKIGEKMENEAGKRPQRKNCKFITQTNPETMDHPEDGALE